MYLLLAPFPPVPHKGLLDSGDVSLIVGVFFLLVAYALFVLISNLSDSDKKD